MAYELLALRKETAGQAGHWQRGANFPYEQNSIEETNSTSTTEPTSIPSPFARMELARSAFEIAAAYDTWEEVPARYKKIVSDCLDVAEIFFNFPMYRHNVEIIKWEKENVNKSPLKDSPLGKAIKKFMDSDNGTYHFDRMDAIYLLNYTGSNRPNPTGLNIIGATSPVTMFFSVDNDLSYVGKHIHFTNQDNPFDGAFNPLEKRDINFIRYLLSIIRSYDEKNQEDGAFARDFKSLYDYIHAACRRLPQGIDLDAKQATYSLIQVAKGANDYVNVLGFYIQSQDAKVPVKSDFEIAASIKTDEKLPLVLPVEPGNAYENCAYIDENDKWGRTNKAPQRDEKPIDSRILPGTNICYPYLTLSDFFEDTIIRMPYKLNAAAYFNGNFNGESDKSYLLPFNPRIFKYFTVEDLKKWVDMRVSGTVVTITLRIPIRNYTKKAAMDYIEYVKTYQTQANEANNVGDTIEAKFGLGVFPLVRTNDAQIADYRIALLDKAGITDVKFSYQAEELENVPFKVRREYAKNSVCGIKTFVIEKKHFDRIDVYVGDKHGYIIPLFKSNVGSKKFKFAVDFGTTNTHIAYSIDNELDSTPLECAKSQIERLHENYSVDKDIASAFEDNYLPTGIASTKIAFPMRSAFAESRPMDYGNRTYTLSDGNIPFRYEKVGPVDYLDIQTGENLKWSAESGRIELYIRNIAFILHNKVLMENGRLEETQVCWFYPASMSTFVRNMMEQAWEKAYRDYFDANYTGGNRLTQMSESIAPYCYYFRNGGALGVIATIDIGGGTTDVYISDGKNGGMLSSFRFASNSIFGDGYNNNINNNGFVNKYRPIFIKALGKDDETLRLALENIAQKGNSSELISFFFSLASLQRPSLEFLDMLIKDQQLKYVFLVFYSAIIYHVAQSMKAKGIEMPQTVVFSGNGSKTLQVISTNAKTQEEFVLSIFEKVYGKKYPADQTFYLKYDKERPKEATANGGISALSSANMISEPQSLVLLGTDNKTFVEEEEYDTLTSAQKAAIIQNVIDFIDFIPSLNKHNEFGNKYNLDVTILDDILRECKKNLSAYLDQGLAKIQNLLSRDRAQTKKVTESLFFFPLVGVLNNLAQYIYAKSNNNNTPS